MVYYYTIYYCRLLVMYSAPIEPLIQYTIYIYRLLGTPVTILLIQGILQ